MAFLSSVSSDAHGYLWQLLSVYGSVIPGAGKGAVHGNKITGMLMKGPKRKNTQATVNFLLTY